MIVNSMNQRILEMLTRLAIDSGGYANSRRVPMAAGITYKKHLIATGFNQMKTHPMMMGDGYREDQMFMHAEVDAIRNALRLITPGQLAQCELNIVRVKRPYSGSKRWIYGIAKPCPGCSKIIASFGIKKVLYTDNREEILDFA